MTTSGKKSISLQMIDDDVEEELRTALFELEDMLHIEGIALTLFNVVMELVNNAVKANLKRVFFEKNGYSLTDPEGYAEGLAAFTRNYTQTQTEEYRLALRDLKLTVSIDMDLDLERLLIHVENNARLLREEEKRIRTKLANAMEGIKDIMDFYLHFGDETEGKGLGLAMVVLLIKDLGFDPRNFRVYHTDNGTVARLEFPLSSNYVTMRDRMEQEKNG